MKTLKLRFQLRHQSMRFTSFNERKLKFPCFKYDKTPKSSLPSVSFLLFYLFFHFYFVLLFNYYSILENVDLCI